MAWLVGQRNRLFTLICFCTCFSLLPFPLFCCVSERERERSISNYFLLFGMLDLPIVIVGGVKPSRN